MMCGDRWLETGSPWEGDEMTEREKHIEMAQRLGLAGMRPHLDGIYIDALAAFAKLVADDARATPALEARIIELENALANYIAQIDRDNKNAAAPLVVGEKERQRACDALRATPALPQAEHDLEDVRCQCCGYMTYHSEHMGCIRSAYKQALPQVPEGMAIVPVEPTPKMIVAFRNSNGFQDGYKAMLAAAKEKGE